MPREDRQCDTGVPQQKAPAEPGPLFANYELDRSRIDEISTLTPPNRFS
jgi:hypothetical protein